MELEVKVTNVSVDDMVATTYDHLEDEVQAVTFGDVMVKALLDRLAQDPRWDQLASRFWDAVDEYLRETAPEHAQRLVEQEVARQLDSTLQGAATRGKASTRAQAIVATEVTTQLRGQFAPLVDAALLRLSRDLDDLSREAIAAFRKGSGR